MNGIVDEQARALLDVAVSAKLDGAYTPVTAWIDTAFDGHLVFPRTLVQSLDLELLAETDAILADGTLVTLEAYVCYVEWFGKRLPLQVIANEGRLALLGTGLLAGRVLHVDYSAGQLSLD